MNEIKRQYAGQSLSDWDPRVRKVQKVLDRLLPYVESFPGLEGTKWEVHVIDSPEQNAFVIPGYGDTLLVG
jgi:predicted Zn-dependent protease